MAREILAAYPRSGTLLDVVGSPTKGGKMKYVFSIQSVNPSTGLTEVIEATSFLPKHAEFAAYKGQTVTADIEISKNGQWQNTDLQDIALGAGIGSGVPAGVVNTPVAVAPAQQAVPAGVTVKPPRDYEAEALGKTRHGQFIAALDYVGRLLQAGALPFDASDDVAVLGKVIQFAEAGVYYATTGGNIASGAAPEITVEAEEAPIVAVATTPAEVAAEVGGVVQVGTSGLPWGAKEA